MKSKIIILTVILIVFGYSAKSQPNEISFRFHSGLNGQTFNGQDMTGDKLDLNFVPRFNLGVMVDFPLISGLYIKSGLLFTTKGAKSDQFMGMDMLVEYNIAYIELPLNFVYKLPLGSGSILLGFGPYLSYGLAGNTEYTISNITMKEEVDFSNEYESLNPLVLNNLKPFDYGGNIIFGYEFKNGFSWQLNTQVGMAMINAENTLLPSKTILKNRGYGLSIEYKF
jgi:hypothetical protein